MSVFLNKGDVPISTADLDAGTQRQINLAWPQWKRERAMRLDPTALNTYMETVATDTDTNRANNTFNQQLADYRAATFRIARYVLSVGRLELSEQQATGALDVNGDPVMEAVVVQTAIAALPATVDGWDNTDPENPVATQVPNPLIVADDAERVVAQNVIDVTPKTVKKF